MPTRSDPRRPREVRQGPGLRQASPTPSRLRRRGQGQGGRLRDRHPARALREVKRLSEWVKRPDWPQTLAAYSRCVRITRDQKERYVVNSDQLSEPAEKDLYAAYQHVSATSVNASAAPSVDDFFAALLPMIPAISKFFDDVLVMAEDRALRENRLGLLQRIAAMATGVADFSKLEGF